MKLEEGQIIEGEITRIVEEAVFVDIGTFYEAIIPRKDLDLLNPRQLSNIREGESIKVCVDRLPRYDGNPFVSIAKTLNIKSKQSNQSQDKDPWNRIAETYQVGDLVKGKVKSIKKYGAFVELPIGVDGLVHVSEMQMGYTDRPWDIVKPGEQVTVRIIRIEPDRKRIGLSLKGVSDDL
jgi:small subunit ribosomal protein S1